ncbi:MAG: CHAT domain-containing protein, partial [Acidobacteriota bacterium]
AEREALSAALEALALQGRELEARGAAAEALAAPRRRERETLEAYRILGTRISGTARAGVTQPASILETYRDLAEDDVSLLQFRLGAERSYAWLLSPAGLASAELAAGEVLEQRALGLHRFLSEGRERLARRPVDRRLRDLSDLLLADLPPLPESRRLVIAAGGALDYVPFAALTEPATQQLLIERFELVRTPSLSTLGALRHRRQGREPAPGILALVADPVFSRSDARLKGRAASMTSAAEAVALAPAAPALLRSAEIDSDLPRLPATADEAQAIAALVPADRRILLLGFDANRGRVTRRELLEHRILHFATHAWIHERHPELSGLALSRFDARGRERDGYLWVYDLARLETRADLVVLSACRTALGQRVDGEGLLGLTQGFFQAGASSLIVSLWDVEDRATSRLMQRFYEHLERSDWAQPAAALRRAQLDLRAQATFDSPYFWAGFMLQGDH